jgi:hypothetical protein
LEDSLRKTTFAVLAVLATAALVPAIGEAARNLTYKGKAKSLVGDFEYGKVTVKRKGSRVKRVKIEAVTASCSFGTTNRTIVFNPKDRGIKILSGSSKIKRGRMSVRYRPDKTVENQTTKLKLKFKGRKVTGRFSETDVCVDKGKFSAKR